MSDRGRKRGWERVLSKERYRAFGILRLYVIVGLLAWFRFGGIPPESSLSRSANDADYDNSIESSFFSFVSLLIFCFRLSLVEEFVLSVLQDINGKVLLCPFFSI